MPRHRPRVKVLRFLRKLNANRRAFNMLSSVILNDDTDDDDDSVNDLIDHYYQNMEHVVSSSRYLFRNEKNRNRKNFFDWDDCLSENSKRFNDEEFMQHFRMSRKGFRTVLEAIRNDEAFKSHPGKMRKAPVSHHLLVFLYRIGKEGSGANDGSIATFFGIGKGSVKNYVRRVTQALVNLRHEVIRWPEDKEKDDLKKRMKIKYGFQKCIGIIDGTLIILDKRPTQYGDSYFCRKQCYYAINVQVICDDKGKVTYFYGGWPGSTHDNRAWRNCKVFNDATTWFEEGEYLLADSAYSACLYIVQAFKKVSGSNLSVHQEFFNTMLGRARVKSEHCIGILKNRFPCLKRMNVAVDGAKGVKAIMQLFTACAVIHNMLLDVDDDIPSEWYDDVDDNHYWTSDYDGIGANGGVDLSSFDRREAVFNSIIEDYYV